MRLSWKLGRVAGIDVFLHPSALLIFPLVSGLVGDPLRAVALAVGLFTSIVLHELGHALMARRYGIATEDITLYLFGGVARLRRMPRSAGPELLVALAGPAVNLAIIAALSPTYLVAGLISRPVADLALALISLNAGLALFNLLPVFPMDGGRVLRALLSGWLGRVRATVIAAGIGQVAALVGGAFFVMAGRWDGAILAGFVYFAAGLERTQVLAEAARSGGLRARGEAPAAPMGFRWVDRGDGVYRLDPTRPGGSWA